MKIVYVPENSIDGHVLIQRLMQNGIEAFLHGENQQSVFGSTVIGGGVRVLVDDEAFDAARVIVKEWEAERRAVHTHAEPQSTRSADLVHPDVGLSIDPDSVAATPTAHLANKGYSPVALLVAAALGALMMLGYQRLQHDHYDSDRNNDGVADERYVYDNSGVITESWLDRNLDGRKDQTSTFKAGYLDQYASDDNFDGRFEYQGQQDGALTLLKMDADGDGFFEYRQTNRFDVIEREEHYGVNGKLARVVSYRDGVAHLSEWDSDGDGVLETKGVFDVMGRESIAPAK
jgi:Putative prokaryotic signal transducing protein